MAYRITRYEETPNPNAIKCWLDRPISEAPRSFLDAGQAEGDPLAAALFAIDGVTTLLFNGDWVTVNKRPDARWATVRKRVERVLAGAESLVPGEKP